jgi:selenide,water dikinase
VSSPTGARSSPSPVRRLSEYSHGAGCACKVAPGALAAVVARLAPPGHPDLLVGALTGDDAAVWRLDDDRALVLTTDFITPVVDDPRAWGRIAATNAASDVYAMGGRPLLALNVVAWNVAELSDDVLVEVLAGALDAAVAGSFVIAGGHTVDDPEPKFGLAVVGEVDPSRMLTNTGLRPGDRLVLTKALGVGVITTGVKRGVAPTEVVDGAVLSMSRLNDDAARVAAANGATGATDVTGFGLLNHLGRMALESRVDVTIDVDAVGTTPPAPPPRCRSSPVPGSWPPRASCPGAPVATSSTSGPASTPAAAVRSTSCCWPTPRRRAAWCSASPPTGPSRRSPSCATSTTPRP